MRDRHQLTLFEPDSSSPTKRAGTAAWPSPGSALEQRYERFRVLAASLPVNLAWAPAPGVSRAGRASSTRENDRRRCWRGGTAQYTQHPLLRTVGIDRSYYSPVPADDLLRYAEQLPERFPCCAKAPAAVTDADVRAWVATAQTPTSCRPRVSSPTWSSRSPDPSAAIWSIHPSFLAASIPIDRSVRVHREPRPIPGAGAPRVFVRH